MTTDALRVRSRLHFSQPSQPSQGQTPSHMLSTALGACRLGASQALEEADVVMSQRSLEVAGCSQLSASQDMGLGTQDYITPADQQFDGNAEPGYKARHMRSPAVLSPNRIKRPRNAAGLRGVALEGMCASQQSQASQPEGCCAGVLSTAGRGLGPGATPDGCMAPPPPRKVVTLRRALSPVCARNAFVDGPDDAEDATGPPRALPVVARYQLEYKEIAPLGSGNFSRVYKVRCRFDGMVYAAKRTARALRSDADKKRWQQEAMAMAAAGTHPNLVRYHCAWMEEAGQPGEHHMYILMEACADSLVGQRIVCRAPMREAELLDLLRQMAEALLHLHARGIAHLDVKPDNIYTTPEGAYKLGDFGLACPCSGVTHTLPPEEGDSRYVAPEALNNDWRAPDKVDLFALGASLYELATGQDLPTGGSKYKDLREGRLALLPGLTAPTQKLLHALMAPDPADRPSAAKVLASQPLVRRAPAREPGKENYGTLNLQPSAVLKGGR